MNIRRALAGAAVITVAAVMGPIIGAGVASAGSPHLGAGSAPAGASTPNPASGNSDTSFALNFTPDQTCPLDSSAEGGNWSSFITPATTDVTQLPFTAGIPSGSGFTNNLFSSTGSQVKNLQVSAAPNRIISNVPTFKISGNGSFGPGTIAPGAYKVGVACFDTTDTQPRYPIKFYSKTITLTADAATGGSSQLDYALGAQASPPTLTAANSGSTTCQAVFTPGTDDPADTSFTATAHPASGPDITQTGSASPITISGLTNNTAYTVSVTASNGVGGPSASSNTLSCTPVAGARNNVQSLTAGAPVPGATHVVVSWNAPAANTPAALPVSYDLNWSGPQTGTTNVLYGTGGPYSFDVTGLTSTGIYTFTVVTNYADAPLHGSAPAPSVQASISPSSIVNQQIDVVRPVGALVLTQVCGSHAAVAGVPAGKPGFPTGTTATSANNSSAVGAPAVINAGDTPGTGYTPKASKNAKGAVTGADPNAPGYPYPTNPDGTVVSGLVYPSWCGLHLNNAKFVTTGPGSGQYFSTSGVMNQVTIVDTRDSGSNPGVQDWSATGIVGQFSDGVGDTFTSKTLGWAPQVSSMTGPFDNGNGTVYTPNPVAGAAVDPGFGAAPTPGLSTSRTLATAVNGLGVTVIDARVDLLIPVTADAALYEATMTLSVG